MKVIKHIPIIILYVIAMFATATIFIEKSMDQIFYLFNGLMFVSTVIFVVSTEIYHKNKNSMMPLISLTLIFLINMMFFLYKDCNLLFAALASIMFAILLIRYFNNTKEKFLGCYNLWLFSAFTILLYFIMVYSGGIIVLLVALITLLNVTKLKYTNEIEFQKVNYIQNIVGFILVTAIMIFI